MMKMIIFLTLFIASSLASQFRFDDYSVLSLAVETPDQLNELRKIKESEFDYSFWKSPSIGHEAEIMVSPQSLDKLIAQIQQLNIKYRTLIKNVQSLIDNERPNQQNRSSTFGWTDYYTLEEIYDWLDELILTHPNILTKYYVGKSYQGREIKAIRLAHNEDNPLIIIESNIHANEWITSATSTWILNELLTSNDPKIQDLAENINWLFLPVLNVDGFAYTKNTNRLWRKTRQPHSHLCYGTDPNRNFDVEWLSIGASPNPCSNNFAGPYSFSEPETRQWAEFIRQFESQTKIYISFHSYGQLFMFPYGHTTTPPENYDAMMSIGNKTADAIAERYNTTYVVGQSSTTIYFNSGSSVDWVFNEFTMKLGLIFELRDRPGGQFGHLLPANQIIPNCLEIMDGMVALVKEARDLHQL